MPDKIIDLGFAKIKIKPVWESTEGQESVSDEAIAAAFDTEAKQQAFFQVMISAYRTALLEDDLATIIEAETRFFFPAGRIEPHFSVRGDGWELLQELKRDIEWVTNLAEDEVVKRVRYAFAMYTYHASGKKQRSEFAISSAAGSLANRIGISNALFRSRTAGRTPPPLSGITRWTVRQAPITKWTITPEGMMSLRPGQVRVYTGQSSDTILSFIERGIELRPPTHPGRAHYGAGTYASLQKPIAESYAEQHPAGLTLPLETNMQNLNVLNLIEKQGRQAFAEYIDSLPGLRSAWKLQENRYIISETFITGQKQAIDIVVAPHEHGTQLVFRSEAALKRLDDAVRRYAAQQQRVPAR